MNHPPDNRPVKVFFALWPTAAEREQLAAWQMPLKKLCGGRAMQAEKLHATLVFIGNVEQSRLEALHLAAQEVTGERFELRFDEARYWGHNHIVYAAPLNVPQQLLQLAGELEENLTRHRFKPDQREYKPHVTLMRNAHWSDAPLPAMPPVRWQAEEFALVQSAHQEYKVLARFPFDSSGDSSGQPSGG